MHRYNVVVNRITTTTAPYLDGNSVIDLPFSLSEADKKLVVIDNFSDVEYLVSIDDFFTLHGSNVSSSPSVSADSYNIYYNTMRRRKCHDRVV